MTRAILTLTEQVDLLYKAYPKKIAPRAAKQAIRFSLQRNTDRSFEDILAAVKAHAANFRIVKGTANWQFVPHPTTYFNGDSWDGEVQLFEAVNIECKVSHTRGVCLEYCWSHYEPKWRKCGCEHCLKKIKRYVENFDQYGQPCSRRSHG